MTGQGNFLLNRVSTLVGSALCVLPHWIQDSNASWGQWKLRV